MVVLELFAAEQAARPVLERLEPAQRAAVVMALLGIVLAGLLLIVIAMLGGNWMRRIARHRPNWPSAAGQSMAGSGDRSRRGAIAGLPSRAKSNETMQIDPGAGETKADRDVQ